MRNQTRAGLITVVLWFVAMFFLMSFYSCRSSKDNFYKCPPKPGTTKFNWR